MFCCSFLDTVESKVARRRIISVVSTLRTLSRANLFISCFNAVVIKSAYHINSNSSTTWAGSPKTFMLYFSPWQRRDHRVVSSLQRGSRNRLQDYPKKSTSLPHSFRKSFIRCTNGKRASNAGLEWPTSGFQILPIAPTSFVKRSMRGLLEWSGGWIQLFSRNWIRTLLVSKNSKARCSQSRCAMQRGDALLARRRLP